MIIDVYGLDGWDRPVNDGRVAFQAGDKDADHPRYLLREVEGGFELSACDGALQVCPTSPNRIIIKTHTR